MRDCIHDSWLVAVRGVDQVGVWSARDDEACDGAAAVLQCDIKGRVATGIARTGRTTHVVEDDSAYLDIIH